MASVLVPVLYMLIVFGGLGVFSYIYRRKAASKRLPAYFPTHAERNAYVSLLQKSDPPASDPLLKSALVRRAMADVQRVLRLREDKPALQALLQKGSIGDELWQSLLAAEKELEAEIVEVVSEANSFVEGWGQVIFPTANEMIANEKMRSMYETSEDAKRALELKYGMKASSSPSLPQITVGPAPSTPAKDTDPESPSKKAKKRK
ncbi:translocation protein sec66 [Roridomyces roridus]|uniref:Translocation protein sec66 n=1 Tax=Roridomyces roridus TaxID=1738132 RepID=A0AAD7BWG9_9AGAR|nr:translocation protein sec66 [Roridomyces roridus]